MRATPETRTVRSVHVAEPNQRGESLARRANEFRAERFTAELFI